MFRNSIIVYPQADSGVLWVGLVCSWEYDPYRKAAGIPSVRIDDVSFARVGCGILDQPIPVVTPIVSLLSTIDGIIGGADSTSV
jgi:hypothetical protein